MLVPTVHEEAALPILITVKRAVEVSGLSEREIYRRIAVGEIIRRKMRHSTLIETASLIAVLKALPQK